MYAAAVLAGALVCAAGPAEVEGNLALRVDRAIGLATRAILAGDAVAGAGTTGEQALAALALLRAGASPEEPRLAGAIRRVFAGAVEATADPYGGTYHAGVFLALMDELGPDADAFAPPTLARALAGRLAELQEDTGGWGDVSRTKFAALGLGAAERLGVEAGAEPWRKCAGFLLGAQRPGGAWAYRPGETPTGSMTAGALAALLCAGVDDDPAVLRGIEWLRANFRADANPGEAAQPLPESTTRHRFYYLWALASLARVRGGWPEPRWAVEAARTLVSEQRADGTWDGSAQDRPTEFAVLLLCEALEVLRPAPARAPVIIGVYTSGADATRAPRLPEAALGRLSRGLAWWTGLESTVSAQPVGPRAAGLAGCAFVLLPVAEARRAAEDDLAELRRFVEGGGVVIVEGDNAAGAEESTGLARRLCDGEPVALGGGWAAARTPAQLETGNAPRLVGICPAGAGGEPSVLVAPEGLFCALGEPGVKVRSEACRLAVNVFAWAASR